MKARSTPPADIQVALCQSIIDEIRKQPKEISALISSKLVRLFVLDFYRVISPSELSRDRTLVDLY